MADSKEQLKCPACGEQMTKVLTKEGVNIDICIEGCGGIWFDNRELAKFDEYDEKAEDILNSLKDKKFKQVDTNAERICPICNTKMVNHKYSINTDVEIDECYNCGGKFLDNNELELIRKSKQPTKEQIIGMVNNLYQETGHTQYVANKNGMINFFNNLYNKYSR